MRFSVGTKVQIQREGSYFGETVTVTDHQVVQGNPATKRRFVRYKVELNNGDFEWFEEHELGEPQPSRSSKLNLRWFLMLIPIVLLALAVVFGTLLLHTRSVINTPKKAVMAYFKQYPNLNKNIVLSKQPAEYYDGGAYVLGVSSNQFYYVFFAVPNKEGKWTAYAVTQITGKDFANGDLTMEALTHPRIPGFFYATGVHVNSKQVPQEVVGYAHVVGNGSTHEIPFVLHRLWNSPYLIHYFPSNTFEGSKLHQSLPEITIDKVVAYGQNGGVLNP